VGLKPKFVLHPFGWEGQPQSNQRGIETYSVGFWGAGMVKASIEPAWD